MWLRLVGSLKLWVSFAEHPLFYRALLQKRPNFLRNLLIEATPYSCIAGHVNYSYVWRNTFICRQWCLPAVTCSVVPGMCVCMCVSTWSTNWRLNVPPASLFMHVTEGCVKGRTYMWYDSFICATYMTHRHDSFMCVTRRHDSFIRVACRFLGPTIGAPRGQNGEIMAYVGVCVCMYVCMYVCMCACVCVCVYVCVYVCVNLKCQL